MGANTARRKTRNILEKVPSFKSISRKYCPPGQILRKAYTRRYTTAVRKRGFTVKKTSGKEYRIHPDQKNMYVEARCIKDRGLDQERGLGHYGRANYLATDILSDPLIRRGTRLCERRLMNIVP